jgi:hypothetical protein
MVEPTGIETGDLLRATPGSHSLYQRPYRELVARSVPNGQLMA